MKHRIILVNVMKVSTFLSEEQLCFIYCQGENFDKTECDKVTNVNARKERYLSKNCTKIFICRICNKKHHI